MKKGIFGQVVVLFVVSLISCTPQGPTGLQVAELEREASADRSASVDFNYCPITINESSTLTADVTASASCVLFGANNIELDCNGYQITWNTGGGNNQNAVWADNRTKITIRNCILVDGHVYSNRSIGINFTRTNHSLAYNNTIRTNGTTNNYGIIVQTNSFNNTFENNTIHTNGTDFNYGIYLLTSAHNNTLYNNTVRAQGTSSSNYGIYLQSSNLNNVTSNTITTNGTGNNNYGILLDTSSSNNLTNNTVNTNGTGSSNRGIMLSTSSSSNGITSNTVHTNGISVNYGIILTSSDSNNITGNTITTNGTTGSNHGLFISSSNSNKVTSNTVTTNGTSTNYGIYLANSNSNNVTSNNILTNGTSTNHGIHINGANNNNATNNTITTQGSSSYGIYFTNTATNNILNNTVLNATIAWISSDATSTNTITNTTFKTGNGSIRWNGTVTIAGLQDLNQTRLNITNNTAFVNTSNLTMLNTTAQIKLNGLSFVTPAVEANYSDGTTFQVCSSPTCISDSYSGGVFTFNVTRFTTYRAAELSSCDTIHLNTTLTNNIAGTGTCMTFGASNIVLDCNGYQITWNTAGGHTVHAVTATGFTNISVKNCVLVDGIVGGMLNAGISLTNTNRSAIQNNTILPNAVSDGYGIQVDAGANNTIKDNSIKTKGTGGSNYGVYLSNYASDNNITNNTIITGGTAQNHGIRVQTASNNLIHNNTILVNGTDASNYGIQIVTNSIRNNITNNTVTTNGTTNNQGIVSQEGSDNTIIENNTVTTNGTTGPTNIGISISSSNAVIKGNTIRTNGTTENYGIYIQGGGEEFLANNNTALNNFIQTNGTGANNHGIYIFTSVSQTNLTNNTILTMGTTDNYGIRLDSATAGTITNNTIQTNGSNSNHGMYINGATNNNATNNTITIRGSTSYGIYFTTSAISNTFNNTLLNATPNWISSDETSTNTITNTTFKTGNGSMRWNGTITIAGLQDLNQTRLNITNNTAFVNTSNLTMLNTTAQIILNGITYTTPRIVVSVGDNSTTAPCTDCVNQSYTGGIYTFNTTHFTTYSTIETPASGNVTGFATNITAVDTGFNVTLDGTVDVSFVLPVNETINLSTATITPTTGLTVVQGITLPSGTTKSVQVNVAAGTSELCIVDTAGATTIDINCGNGVTIACPGTVDTYECTIANNIATITGLSNTAVGGFSRSSSAGGGSGGAAGGSSGGGGGPEKQQPAKTVQMNTNTATYSLQKGDTVVLFHQNQQHTISVLSLTPRTVTISMANTPQEHVMRAGTPLDIDLNKDGTNDLNIKLAGIDTTGAHITITKIPQTSPTLQKPWTPNMGTPETTAPPTEEQPTPANPIEKPAETQTPTHTNKEAIKYVIVALTALIALVLSYKIARNNRIPAHSRLGKPPRKHF